MVEQLRTELHPEVHQRLASNRAQGTHVRSNQLSVEGARQLKRDTMEVSGWLDDPEAVWNVRQYPLAADGGEFPIRIYTPADEGPFPVLVWLHGGGWVRGSIDGDDPICRTLANDANCVVVSVEYRLAPEYPFPVGLEDSYTALEWVAANHDVVQGDPDRIAVGGKSAGGNLAVALALLARDRDGPAITQQVPCIPVLDRPRETASYEENAAGYGLSRADMDWYWNHYMRTDVDEANPYAAPLQARDFSGLPPATVLTAGFDPVRDDGIEYVARLEDAGVPIDHHHYPDVAHDLVSTAYHYEDVGRAREAVGAAAESLRTAFSG